MAEPAAGRDRRTFAALENRNFRRYFIGQACSQIGTWMQIVGLSWLVYQLTGSGTAIGIAVAMQSLPMLVLGPYGGVIADRVDRRRLVKALQLAMGALALVLAVLTLSGLVQVWQVYILALLLGIARVFEIPARQAFLLDMVGPDDLRNAVTLHSITPNAARAIGPAAAGALIAFAGAGVCFLANAVSFAISFAMLATLDLAKLRPTAPTARERGQLRAGLRYAFGDRALAAPLVMMAFVGALALQWQVVLPVVAKQTFSGGPQTYGFLFAALGAGAVAGALFAARYSRIGNRALTCYASAFGAALLLGAVTPSLQLEFVALAGVGFASVLFMSTCNATLQLASATHMRGRVIALYIVAIDGLNVVGAPAVGAAVEHGGGRSGLAAGALACLAAGGVGVYVLRRGRRGADGPEPKVPFVLPPVSEAAR